MKKRVLVLCTGNSCRSIMGEVILNAHLSEFVEAQSAGVSAKGEVHPDALRVLEEKGYQTEGVYSKNLDTLENLAFDFVLTVCDHAHETCPMFPYNATVVHEGFNDPDGHDIEIFRDVCNRIEERLVERVRVLCGLQ